MHYMAAFDENVFGVLSTQKVFIKGEIQKF